MIEKALKSQRLQARFFRQSLIIIAACLVPIIPVIATCSFGDASYLTILSIVSAIVIASGLAYIFSKRQANRFQLIQDGLLLLSDGKLPEKLNAESEDELGSAAKAINNLIDRMNAAASFSNKIGNGELNIKYDSKFENDILAHSLQTMHSQLKKAEQDNEKRNWLNKGLANFGEILRTTDSDLVEVSRKIISNLVKYLKANQGQLYVVVANDKEEHLELMATYAWNKIKHVSGKIGKGDGLAGQAWVEKATVYLTEIPADYIRITSGLGEALPTSIAIVPLKLNDEVFGIIELGSFNKIQPHELEFVEKLAELIASTLSTAKVNQRTRELLAESQHQTEELRRQEEEMRQNMEELNATQEEMSRKDIEMTGILTGINHSMATIEFTMDGHIVNANEKFLQFSGYTLEEIRQRHHSMFLDEEYAASPEYARFWKDLNRGIAQTGEFQRRVKHGKKAWISASYTVVKNKTGIPLKVIKFAIDITDQKMKALDFEGQINAVNKTMAAIEFNLDGIITSANENFLAAMGYERADILNKHHSMFVDPTASKSSDYLKFWEDLRNGVAQTGEFKRFGKGGKQVWIQASYTPIKNADGKVYKIIKFAQDITNEKLKSVDFEGQISAIRKSNAVIEFDLTGKILYANDLFVTAMGYQNRTDIIDQHHSIFVSELEIKSGEYSKFWERLQRGEYLSGEFQRKKADGKNIWIHGSYNPILNLDGRPYKIVKYAQVLEKGEEDVRERKVLPMR